jgi:murein DD-endopeptidase MepM/ murein hydrolase activator NlpD
MLRSPDEEDVPLRHRPLPSVDIALLPHELRAIRQQRLAIAGAVAALVLVLVGSVYGKNLWTRAHAKRVDRDDDPADMAHLEHRDVHAASAMIPTAGLVSRPMRTTETTRNGASQPLSRIDVTDGPNGPLSRVEYKFGKARSFHDALVQCGASPSEADDLIGALRKLVDFRHGKPEDRFIFERDEDKQLRAFEYRAGITDVYRAVRDESGALRGVRVDIPIERRRIDKGTFVAGTLGHSLEAIGLGSGLAGLVTEAFGGRISFTRDTRTGDSVKIIVDEEYVDGQFLRYGAVQAIEYASERIGKLQAYWYEPERGDGEFFDNNGRALHGGWLRTPVRYDHISSPYNLKRRHPILKRVMPHLGIDYSASTGTPVWAAAAGVVTFAGPRGPNGNLVSLRHSNGFESHYAHLWKIGPGIRVGVHLSQRQVLGFVGSTGRSTGPHLHFAMKRRGHFVDPASLLNGPGEPLPAAQMARFRATTERLRNELAGIELAAAPTLDGAPKPDDDDEDDADLDL